MGRDVWRTRRVWGYGVGWYCGGTVMGVGWTEPVWIFLYGGKMENCCLCCGMAGGDRRSVLDEAHKCSWHYPSPCIKVWLHRASYPHMCHVESLRISHTGSRWIGGVGGEFVVCLYCGVSIWKPSKNIVNIDTTRGPSSINMCINLWKSCKTES